MSERKITNPLNVKFEPFDNYGAPIPGMSWHKISYNQKVGQGSYILKMEPGAKSLPHKHTNYEEFLVLVHGFLGSSKMWKPQINFFKNYFRVITPDLPGFGKSNKAKSHNNIQSIANLLLDCLHEKKN